jgi:hypothetical protein
MTDESVVAAQNANRICRLLLPVVATVVAALWAWLSSDARAAMVRLESEAVGGGDWLSRRDEEDQRHGSVLVVVAHPDDEAMFFVPTIVHFRDAGWRVHVLSLSTGTCPRVLAMRVLSLSDCVCHVTLCVWLLLLPSTLLR